eukprot:ANDGO_05812.mRNA.1 hypothetical protein
MFQRYLVVQFGFVFRNDLSLAVLKEGLQRTLVHFPLFVGRLVLGSEDDMRICIEKDDLGDVLLEEFHCPARLSSVEDIEAIFISTTSFKSPCPFWPTISTELLFSANSHQEQLLKVRITRFASGECIVAVSAAHIIVDGFSLSYFVKYWSDECRELMGLPRSFVLETPSMDRMWVTASLGACESGKVPTSVQRLGLSNPEVSRAVDCRTPNGFLFLNSRWRVFKFIGSFMWNVFAGVRLVDLRIPSHVLTHWHQHLKRLAEEQHQEFRLSENDLLVSLVWYSMNAADVKSMHMSRLFVACDLRRRLDGAQHAFIGNGVLPIVATCPVSCGSSLLDLESDFPNIAQTVRSGIDALSRTAAESVVQWLAKAGPCSALSIRFGGPDVLVSTWKFSGLERVDFGADQNKLCRFIGHVHPLTARIAVVIPFRDCISIHAAVRSSRAPAVEKLFAELVRMMSAYRQPSVSPLFL